MNFSEYQQRAVGTAIYPREAAVAYPALGLIGELCELTEKYYDDSPPSEVIKECGDVLWYCANLCNDLDASLELETRDPGFSDPPTLPWLGHLAETAKKYVRDRADLKRAMLLGHVRVAVCIVNMVASSFHTSLETVMELNLEKLQSRKERGVLTGDGDNR